MTTAYLTSMTRHWGTTLKLPVSSSLIKGWEQLEQSVQLPEGCDQPWRVVQLPTGSGKTEALKVLCAIGSKSSMYGTLIVTKFTEEADKLAGGINEIAGGDVAYSAHTKRSSPRPQISNVPILVTTHSAFRNALVELASKSTHKSQWDRLWSYGQGFRSRLIVDEAFDWVQSFRVDLSELLSLRGALDGTTSLQFNSDLQALGVFADSIVKRASESASDWALSVSELDQLRQIDLGALRLAVARLSVGETDVWTTIEKSKWAMKRAYLAVLDELASIQQTKCVWGSKRGLHRTLHSSRSLLETARASGVILDATAGVDPAYSTVAGSMNLLPRPCGIRNYSNVQLNVSLGHRVGKVHLQHHSKAEWRVLRLALAQRLEAHNRLLVCCHKVVEPLLDVSGLNCSSATTAHWGDLDGKNDWKDCDVGVFFGLPYLDDIVPTNALLAGRLEQSESEFAKCGVRDSKPNLVRDYKDRFIAKSVVQAMNRLQCRTPIDAGGNCKPTQVYLLLGNDQMAHKLISTIRSQMPGIQIRNWEIGLRQPQKELRALEIRLIDHLKHNSDWPLTKSNVIASLQVSKRSFERLSPDLRNCDSAVYLEMRRNGFTYQCSTGRGSEATFVRSSA